MTEGAVHQASFSVWRLCLHRLGSDSETTAQEENPLLLILDGLTDPHNLDLSYGQLMRKMYQESSFLSTGRLG